MSYTTRNRKAWSVNEFLAGLLIGWFTAGPVVLFALAFARAGDDD